MKSPKVGGRRQGAGAQWARGLTASVVALLVAAGLPAQVEAQQPGQISGTITAQESGAPLPSVQVVIAGTGLGTLTNQQGRFTIQNVPAGSHQLRAERLGYGTVTQDVTVTAGETTSLDFQMRREALGLDAVVVTGTAGAARRREVGNTISQINMDELPARPVTVSQALTANAPGLEVLSAGGEIGMGSRIQIRGQSSLSMTNQPIIYIDGVRMRSEGLPHQGPPDRRGGRSANVTASPLDQLNPNDIERVEVIKGAAATTLYGTEASAGVIQIFTRRGQTAAPVWTLETQQGTAWSRKFGPPSAPYDFMEPFFRSDPFGIGDGDWGTVWNQQYSASVRGGGEALQYFVSGQMQDFNSIMPQDALERWTVRSNFTFTPLPGLQVDWNNGYSNTWMKNTPSANNAQGLTLNVIRRETNYFGTNDPEVVSQLFVQDFQNEIERFTTGGTVTYSPTGNLTNRFTIGYDYNQQLQRHLRPFGFIMTPQGILHVDKWENRLLTFDYVGTYRFSLTDDIRSSFSWGGQAVGDDEQRVEAYAEDFPGAAAPTVNSGAINMGFEERQKVWNAGFFLQNMFDIRDKYFITAGFRVDGNSAFGQDFGLQFYPRASLAWVVSDEDFWNPDWGQFRLRTAYGQAGRAPGAFDAVRTWQSFGYRNRPAFTPSNVGNAELGPEVSTEIEGGFEAAWFDGRLTVDVTHFRQTTSDALLNMPQMPSLGFSSAQQVNIGELKSWGTEIDVGASVFQRPDWGLDMRLSYSTNGNEITDLGGREPTSTIQEGYPIRPLVNWRVMNPDAPTSANGDIEYHPDGSQYMWGPTHPTQIHSVGGTLRVPRGITLSAQGEYRGGHYRNNDRYAVGRSTRAPICDPHYRDPDIGPQGADFLKEGTPALWRARCAPALNGRGFVYKMDFFRLRNVTATVPVDFAFPAGVSSASLTLSLDNSYLWTKELDHTDPEMLGNDGINTDASGISERVPNPIALRLGLRITF
jgi:TonB-dependent starch-binding outer membrane protein SusC